MCMLTKCLGLTSECHLLMCKCPDLRQHTHKQRNHFVSSQQHAAYLIVWHKNQKQVHLKHNTTSPGTLATEMIVTGIWCYRLIYCMSIVWDASWCNNAACIVSIFCVSLFDCSSGVIQMKKVTAFVITFVDEKGAKVLSKCHQNEK